MQYRKKKNNISFFVISYIDKRGGLWYNTAMKNFYKTQHSFVFENSFCDWETGALLSPIQLQNYEVLQVAELYYNNAFHINNHLQHCDLEVTFPTTNGLFCQTDERLEKLRKHEAYLSFKGEKHLLFSRVGCRFQTFAVNFTNPQSQELFRLLKQRFLQNRKQVCPQLAHYFTAIIGEFLSTKQDFFAQSLESLITTVLVNLVRKEVPAPQEKLATKTTTDDILQYIDAHFLDICSLEELSATFGYTYGHICKIFKNAYDVTPVEYLLRKKMEYAALLLSEGKRLAEIAEVTGYSTPCNLSRAFKKHFGTYPSNFKKGKE